jgi:hypothetical protein
MNWMSDTPLVKPPEAGVVWLEGRWSITVVRCPLELIFEIREVNPPV